MTADYTLLQTFIEAASDTVEQLSATAMVTEQILLTFDFFPGQADPRQLLSVPVGLRYDWAPFWWAGSDKGLHRASKTPGSVEPKPVVAPTVTYNDVNGDNQTLDLVHLHRIRQQDHTQCWLHVALTDRRQGLCASGIFSRLRRHTNHRPGSVAVGSDVPRGALF